MQSGDDAPAPPRRIPVAHGLSLAPDELQEKFVRASGPGGQNVNKVSTAVELRFDLQNSPSLPDDVKARAAKLAGRKLSSAGILVIKAQSARTQEMNREAAQRMLIDLLAQAAVAPRRRIATKVPRSQKTARRDAKAIRSRIKSSRGRASADD